MTPRPASSVWNGGGKTFCGACGTVKRESLDFLSDNPFYSKRLSCYVGRRCRGSSINRWQRLKPFETFAAMVERNLNVLTCMLPEI